MGHHQTFRPGGVLPATLLADGSVEVRYGGLARPCPSVEAARRIAEDGGCLLALRVAS